MVRLNVRAKATKMNIPIPESWVGKNVIFNFPIVDESQQKKIRISNNSTDSDEAGYELISVEFKLAGSDLWQNIQSYKLKSGVYRLLSRGLNNECISILRVLGLDQDGTLYLGKTSDFSYRIINLKKGIRTLTNITASYQSILRYRANEKLQMAFPYESLYIELFPSENPREMEITKLRDYFDMFGEVPPLNSNN